MQTTVTKIALFFLLLFAANGMAQTTVQIVNGGTGATTAAAALANLNGLSSVITTPQVMAGPLGVGDSIILTPPSGDATSYVQAALNSYQDVTLNPGPFTVTPANHSGAIYALSIPTGTHLHGTGTIKVANAVGDYDELIYAQPCTNCTFDGFTIDSNVANNSWAGHTAAQAYAHPRIEMSITGNGVKVDGIKIQNSSSVNAILVTPASSTGQQNTVVNCILSNIGDDASHLVHDTSPIYVGTVGGGMSNTGAVVTNNQVFASSFAAPAAGSGTGIEIHSNQQVVSGNTVWGFGNGLNITGNDFQDDESIAVTGNSLITSGSGILLWSSIFGSHTSGYGLKNFAVTGNAITIHQNGYTQPSDLLEGIGFYSPSPLPVANGVIANNVVTFDLDSTVTSDPIITFGIGKTDAAPASNVTIQGNVIANSPGSGIAWYGVTTNINILNNTLIDAGTSLNSTVGSFYKIPIDLNVSAGSQKININNNIITDDLAVSVMREAMFLGCVGPTPDVQILDNSVNLFGATKTSWISYFYQADNNCNPLVRMVATDEPWFSGGYPAASMQAGSTVYDRTVMKQWNLLADGTGWTTRTTQEVKNLVPDSDMKFPLAYWGLLGTGASFANTLGVGGTNAISVSSAGSGSSAYGYSYPFNLVCGQTYTLSGFVDATQTTAGNPGWHVANTGISIVYATAAIPTAGVGVVSATFTFSPSGCTVGNLAQVVVYGSVDLATINSGKNVYLSAPMVESGATLTNYVTNVLDDDTGHILAGALASNTIGCLDGYNHTPCTVGTIDLTAQASDIGWSTAYAIPAGLGGMYQVSCYTVATQAATSSSTLPACGLRWTDEDTGVVPATITMLGTSAANTVGTTGAVQYYNPILPIKAAASTNVQYVTSGYASSGATPMQFAIHLKVEYLGP